MILLGGPQKMLPCVCNSAPCVQVRHMYVCVQVALRVQSAPCVRVRQCFCVMV